MDARTSEGSKESMAITWTAGHSRKLAAAYGWFSDLLSQPLDVVRIWCEELNRALVATHRCEQLGSRRGTGLSFRDRASKTRLVFDEIYAGK